VQLVAVTLLIETLLPGQATPTATVSPAAVAAVSVQAALLVEDDVCRQTVLDALTKAMLP
jgi:hypothetical protein